MKFKIVESTSKYDLENQLENWVEHLEASGWKVVDVQYGGVGRIANNYGAADYYSAMIIYKE